MKPGNTFVIAALLSAALFGCEPPPPMEKIPRPLRVQTPTAMPCDNAARFSGIVEPMMSVDLAFRFGGYVEEILKVRKDGKNRSVDEGDFVKKGTVLARLRDADYLIKLDQANAALAEARANLAQAKQDFDRALQMFQNDVLPAAALDAARTKAAGADAAKLASEARVNDAKLQIRDCLLRAPFDGVIFERRIEKGSIAVQGATSFVISDASSVKIVFGVPDRMLKEFPKGTTVDVTVDAEGSKPFFGTVISTAPSADSKSRLFDVEVKLDNRDGRFRAGMAASVALRQNEKPSVPTVPLSALVRPSDAGEGFAVYVMDRNILRSRRVVPGRLCADRVEIVEGIKADDRVVIVGAADSYDGELAQVVP